MFVNLKQLARVNNKAGELAGILIGKVKTPTDPDVDRILQNLESSFEEFKVEKEVHDVMTRTDIIAAEARAELLPLIDEQAEQLDEQAEQLVEKDKLLKEANAEKDKLLEQAYAEKIENAQRMIKDNFSEEMIMRYTGLSIGEIKQLQQ